MIEGRDKNIRTGCSPALRVTGVWPDGQGSMDDLFERDVSFAAAPDTFPPDRFNAGVMLVRPDITVRPRPLNLQA